MNNKKPTRLLVVAVAAATAFTVGCKRGGPDADMPDLATLALESPDDSDDDDDSSSAAQAICASDTAAYDEIKERIETYNDALQGRIAVIKAMMRAARRDLARSGEYERSATRNGFTLALHAVEADGVVTYEATLTNPEAETLRMLEGTANSDLTSGSWDVYRANDELAVHVEWSKAEDGTLTVQRDAVGVFGGERSSTYVRTDSTVTIDFAGPEHDAHAEWDRETKDGSITIDDNRICWDADPEAVDFCTVPCS